MEMKKRNTQKTILAYYQKRTETTEATFPELPLDIKVEIISRLPLKLIMRCKCLSKAFNNLISSPPFFQLYLKTNNRSNIIYILFVESYKEWYRYESVVRLDLIELDLNEALNNNSEGNRLPVFDLDELPGWVLDSNSYSFMSRSCNGLLITKKLESGLFVVNPIMRQFIQLPKLGVGSHDTLAYGIGFCRLTNRYKVLRITKYTPGKTCDKYYSEIFTIGSDQNWRTLEYYVPYSNDEKYGDAMPEFRSALHWPGGTCICAFDMTQEKASAIPMPPLVDSSFVRLTVLQDKLSVWEIHGHANNDVTIWAMDDYGVKCSWTKQFVFKLSTLTSTFQYTGPFNWIPLSLLPGGVLVVCDCCQLVFYDMNKDECLRDVEKFGELYSYVPSFVPSFVPLRNPFQE